MNLRTVKIIIILAFGVSCGLWESRMQPEELAQKSLERLCFPVENSKGMFVDTVDKAFANSAVILGEGGYGLVKSVPVLPHTTAGQPQVAVKRISMPPRFDSTLSFVIILNEVEFLTRTQTSANNNLLRFYTCYLDQSKGYPQYYLVMEKLGRALIHSPKAGEQTQTNKFRMQPPQDRLKVYAQLAEQMEWIHSQGFAVNDFKPENVVFEENSVSKAKIIDFGGITLLGNTMTACTPFYLSNEGLDDRVGSKANDAWAFGISLAVIELGSEAIRRDLHLNDNLFEITFDKEYWERVNMSRNAIRASSNIEWMKLPEKGNFHDLLASLLHEDPSKRLTNMKAVARILTQISEVISELAEEEQKTVFNFVMPVPQLEPFNPTIFWESAGVSKLYI